eukprot:gene13312-15731_t
MSLTTPEDEEPEDLHFSDVVKAVKGKDVFKTEHHVAALKYFMPSGRISDRTKQQGFNTVDVTLATLRFLINSRRQRFLLCLLIIVLH